MSKTSPAHYKQHPSGIECIDVIEHYNFNIGNTIKYLWRQGLKDGESSEDDLEKALYYLKLELKAVKRRRASAPKEPELLEPNLQQMQDKITSLLEWKDSALIVMAEWDQVFDAIAPPCELGASKPAAALRYVKSLSRPLTEPTTPSA